MKTPLSSHLGNFVLIDAFNVLSRVLSLFFSASPIRGCTFDCKARNMSVLLSGPVNRPQNWKSWERRGETLDYHWLSSFSVLDYQALRPSDPGETVTSPWLSRSVILPTTSLKGLILIIKSTYQPWYCTLKKQNSKRERSTAHILFVYRWRCREKRETCRYLISALRARVTVY